MIQKKYFKCPKCDSEDFYIYEYQIFDNYIGKIGIDCMSELKQQPDLIGYTESKAICGKCQHSISIFNEGITALFDKLRGLPKTKEEQK